MRVLQKIFRPTLEFENAAYNRGFSKIAGIDEAGRGPLAGPVVVAAVILGKIGIPSLSSMIQSSLPLKKDRSCST